MYNDYVPVREYREFVRDENLERPAFDEYGSLAARDALTEAYGLDRYPNPKTEAKSERTATAAQTGGIFVAEERGERPCRA